VVNGQRGSTDGMNADGPGWLYLQHCIIPHQPNFCPKPKKKKERERERKE
jgi:hypothetical protein